jgi:hypothetical protein
VFPNFIRLLFLSRKRREPVLGGLDSPFTKNLRFAAKALQCCRGVKEKARGRKTAGYLLQGLRSPGPPNRE